MVKRRTPNHADRYMTEYRMRTSYATPTPTRSFRGSPDQETARSLKKHSAHERSHARHDPNEAFYHSQGRIAKSPRSEKTHPNQSSIPPNNSHHQQQQQPETTEKKSSCCTIL